MIKKLWKILLVLALTGLMYTPLGGSTQWPLAKVMQSITRVSDGGPISGSGPHCTAFSIGGGKFLTAGHCTDIDPVFLGTEPAKFDLINKDEDLAILESTGNVKLVLPPLKLGKPPQPGDQLLMTGYAADFAIPVGHFAVLAAPDALWRIDNDETWNRMTFTGDATRGMSGGPVINQQGEVVSVTLCGTDVHMSCGARYQALKEAFEVGKFLSNVQKKGTSSTLSTSNK